jgi:nucleotide-binding universal stress UspA family protein
MPDWNSICCAVDFSEPSRLAMEQASELARRFGADLTLVYVHEPPRAAATDFIAAPVGVAAEAGVEIERTMEGWRSDAEGLAGRAVRSSILMGTPAAEIAHFAEAHGCDLVVLATHGRTGLKRLVLGSVAEQVVRQAPCPVLVARRRQTNESDPPGRGPEPRRAT